MAEPGRERSDADAAAFRTIKVSEVADATDQKVFIATRDGALARIYKHQGEIQARDDWIGPLGILVTVLLAFFTTDFQERFKLGAQVWQAIFFAIGLASLGFLVVNLRNRKKRLDPEAIVDILMGEAVLTHGNSNEIDADAVAAENGKDELQSRTENNYDGRIRDRGVEIVETATKVLRQGAIVEHKDFGRGHVLEIESVDGQNVARVRFDSNTFGVKRLRLDANSLHILSS